MAPRSTPPTKATAQSANPLAKNERPGPNSPPHPDQKKINGSGTGTRAGLLRPGEGRSYLNDASIVVGFKSKGWGGENKMGKYCTITDHWVKNQDRLKFEAQ